MKQRELVSEIARRLPFTTRSQVEDVIGVLTELWGEELAVGRGVFIPTIGRLTLEFQQMKRGGMMREHGSSQALLRLYGRFRPSPVMRERIKGKAT